MWGKTMTKEGLKRKLTAILSADVEGYSRLMGDDEESTIRTLTTYRSAMTSLVKQYRGRVVDAPGDNLLAEFISAVDAVTGAVEIQRELAERNAKLSLEMWLRRKIGSMVTVLILLLVSKRLQNLIACSSVNRFSSR
jgi:adenylate cyclase